MTILGNELIKKTDKVFLYDTFTDVDDTLLENHTIGPTNKLGVKWNRNLFGSGSGYFKISNNKTYPDRPTTSSYSFIMPYQSFTLETVYNSGIATNYYPGIYFYVNNTSNMCRFLLNKTTNLLYILKYITGTPIVLAQIACLLNDSTDYLVSCTISPTFLSIRFGSTYVEYSGAVPQAGNLFGFLIGTSTITVPPTFDYMKLTAL